MEGNVMRKPLGDEMEFFRQYNEVLFNQLEKKILDKETANQQLRISVEEYRKARHGQSFELSHTPQEQNSRSSRYYGNSH